MKAGEQEHMYAARLQHSSGGDGDVRLHHCVALLPCRAPVDGQALVQHVDGGDGDGDETRGADGSGSDDESCTDEQRHEHIGLVQHNDGGRGSDEKCGAENR